MVINKITSHLDSNKLLKHSLFQFREIRKEIDSDIQSIDYHLNELMETIILSNSNYTSNWKDNNPQDKKLTSLKIEKK